jgi:hypothetical protein
MSAPQPPTTLPATPTITGDDLYAQLAKATALTINTALQMVAVNSANMASIAHGALSIKALVAPVSADSVAMLRQMQQGDDPFGKTDNPIET